MDSCGNLWLSGFFPCSMVAPIEFIPRLGKLGLGAAPKPQENPTRRRPGEPKKKVKLSRKKLS